MNYANIRFGKYKYKLLADEKVKTDIKKSAKIQDFIRLTGAGYLTVFAGYAWDGPSGPAVDSPTNMRASLFHDALYQLIREGKLSAKHRRQADLLYYRLCKQDKMNPVRALAEYLAIRAFGWMFTKKRVK